MSGGSSPLCDAEYGPQDYPGIADATSRAPEKRPTFADLVTALAQSEDALADPNFDPEQLLGDLRDKVDGCQAVIERMETVSTFLRLMVAPIAKRASTLMTNRARLRDYIGRVMEEQKFHALPGQMWKLRLRESNPALEITREAPCGPQDYADFPGFVVMTRSYSWDNAKIKDALLNDPKSIPPELPARIIRGCWPEFVPNVPEQLETKKKRKKQ